MTGVAVSSPKILILSGDGASALAAAVLPGYECFDWDSPPPVSACEDRDIQIWGTTPAATAKLAGRYVKASRSVCIVELRDNEQNSDFSSVLQERMTADAVIDFMQARRREILKPVPKNKTNGQHAAVVSNGLGSALSVWQDLGLQLNGSNFPYPTLANFSTIVQKHPDFSGKIWYDEFRGKIYTNIDGRNEEWSDDHDRNVTVWLQQSLKLDKATPKLVQQAVLHAASCNRFNSVTRFLDGLTWDGTPRRFDWLIDYLGCPATEHVRAAGSNWLLSMIARAYDPGSKVDHIPVLEGRSSIGKAKALRILGGEWYVSTATDFGSFKFTETIQGAWLVEIPDMSGFERGEYNRIIAYTTIENDRYRTPWDRHASDHPRRCVFVATSENADYLRSTVGKRRFWPIPCGEELELEAFAAVRDQLLAEAVHYYKAGHAWHEMPDSTTEEQLERIEEDTWEHRVMLYVTGQIRDNFGGFVQPILTSASILEQAIGVALKDQHDGMKRKVKNVLIKNGWAQYIGKIDGNSLRMWRKHRTELSETEV